MNSIARQEKGRQRSDELSLSDLSWRGVISWTRVEWKCDPARVYCMPTDAVLAQCMTVRKYDAHPPLLELSALDRRPRRLFL